MPEPASPAPLLEPDFMARLEQLELVSRKIFMGRMKGERRSKRKGQSVEFADYRNYVVGDDLRFLDWNLYARLDKLFLRLFMEEEDLHVYLLIDNSLSMDFGTPTKLHYARQVAAAPGRPPRRPARLLHAPRRELPVHQQPGAVRPARPHLPPAARPGALSTREGPGARAPRRMAGGWPAPAQRWRNGVQRASRAPRL